jgi:hypothetical protein
MTLLEARDCILTGIGTDGTSNDLLSVMPVAERAGALVWISEHLDKDRLTGTEYGAVEDLLQEVMDNDAIHDSRSEMGRVFVVLQELRNLVLHGRNGGLGGPP